jgi:hypothetical protein
VQIVICAPQAFMQGAFLSQHCEAHWLNAAEQLPMQLWQAESQPAALTERGMQNTVIATITTNANFKAIFMIFL